MVLGGGQCLAVDLPPRVVELLMRVVQPLCQSHDPFGPGGRRHPAGSIQKHELQLADQVVGVPPTVEHVLDVDVQLDRYPGPHHGMGWTRLV